MLRPVSCSEFCWVRIAVDDIKHSATPCARVRGMVGCLNLVSSKGACAQPSTITLAAKVELVQVESAVQLAEESGGSASHSTCLGT